MLARIECVNPDLNAYVHHDPDQVRADARALTDELSSGDGRGPLHGVPYSIKELTSMEGLPLTFGLVPLKDNVGEHDAALVRRLRDAGGLFLGKTNSPESGYYGATDNHLFGPTHNAWRQGMTAGGSSGGAAAAVAAGLGPLAEGSDGAGSVRIPAAINGVVGFKPSTGRIPQTVLAGRFYSWAFHGPITRTVADAALMLEVMAGPDPSDPMTLPDASGGYLEAAQERLGELRIAWSPDLGFADVDPEIRAICERAVGAFAELGCHVVEATPAWADPEEAMWEGIWLPGFASEATSWTGRTGAARSTMTSSTCCARAPRCPPGVWPRPMSSAAGCGTRSARSWRAMTCSSAPPWPCRRSRSIASVRPRWRASRCAVACWAGW